MPLLSMKAVCLPNFISIGPVALVMPIPVGWLPRDSSPDDSHRPVHRDLLDADTAPEGDGLDAGGARLVEGGAIAGVDVARQGEARGFPALDQEDHDGTVALARHVAHLAEMLDATRGDGIRELGEPVPAG